MVGVVIIDIVYIQIQLVVQVMYKVWVVGVVGDKFVNFVFQDFQLYQVGNYNVYYFLVDLID